ncbi:hypothetical protein PGRAN_02605 [Listeria grandensis FSL F6-0971]|uniref:Uncharacterized protein n=1 Tax=Listeria grandensis FSL F6-0971 TaxID=1265819 RepID=W7BJ10_9LIST|nr:hypothetical protein PGRAN_02605 [Listeria grandensis FSL F6-0971]
MMLELGTIAVNVKPHIEFLSPDASRCLTCGGIGVVKHYVGYAVANGTSFAEPKLTACPVCNGRR